MLRQDGPESPGRRWFLAAAALFGTMQSGIAAAPLRLGLQKTGTVSWEIDTIRRHGLDARHGVALAVTELASPEAARIALRGGSVDVIVSDWLWVSRERSLGARLKYVPFSTAVGALVVARTSTVAGIADLRGKRIAVSGGALNANWLLLRALARREGLDLVRDAQPAFGAAPLLMEKTLQGEFEVALTFWNFAARLETQGFRQVLSVEDMARALGAGGAVSNLGYIFDEALLAGNGPALAGFLAASRDAKRILATSDAEWEALRPLMMAGDEATFEAYRRRFREGIPTRAPAEEEADARTLYGILASIGGREVVGAAPALDPGTFHLP
jgi:NitT/TauT family transport system substrate-binding protein